MALLTWLAVGTLVVLGILFLGVRLNQKKATAALAVRLAEAYRSRGQFDAALALYDVPRRLDQNTPDVREGRALAERGVREPVIDEGLVEGAIAQLERDPAGLEAFFTARGVEVMVPSLVGEGAPPQRRGDAKGRRDSHDP